MIAQTATATDAAAGGMAVLIIQLVAIIIVILPVWKLFIKAGQPGWASIIPIYNYVVLLRIAGMPWWWLLLMFVPIANVVVGIIVTVCLAQKFNRGAGTIIGLIFLPIIFLYILALGSAEYDGQATTMLG